MVHIGSEKSASGRRGCAYKSCPCQVGNPETTQSISYRGQSIDAIAQTSNRGITPEPPSVLTEDQEQRDPSPIVSVRRSTRIRRYWANAIARISNRIYRGIPPEPAPVLTEDQEQRDPTPQGHGQTLPACLQAFANIIPGRSPPSE